MEYTTDEILADLKTQNDLVMNVTQLKSRKDAMPQTNL